MWIEVGNDNQTALLKVGAIKPVQQPDSFKALQVSQSGDEFRKYLYRAFNALGGTGLYRSATGLLEGGMDYAYRS